MTAPARQRITLNKLHKWAGLAVALWLAVLAVTGAMQLNRQVWNWQWASGPTLDESIAAHDDKYLWRHHQIDPAQPGVRVASGAAGAFLTENGGKSWQRLPFGDRPLRNVSVLEPVIVDGQWTVLAGTEDGVWQMDRSTRRMVAIGLQGMSVNGLSAEGERLVAAVGMSRLFSGSLDGTPDDWQPMQLGALPDSAGAGRVDLGRLLQDIHLGRGLFGGMIDWALWNIVALGLFLLSLTGFAYWAIMRWCNRVRLRPKEKRPTSAAMRKAQKAIQWSFRMHAMVIGIVLAVPLLLIFVTGLYQDHRHDVQGAFRSIPVPGFLLPPAYRGSGWQGQLMNVAVARDNKGEFLAIANRRGVFMSRDEGRSWAREDSFKGPAMRLRKIDGALYVPGRMMRRVQVRRDGVWQTLAVPPAVVFVNEMSAGPGGTIWWTRENIIFRTDMAGQMRGKADHQPPTLGYLPWGSFAAELHEGVLIFRHWKWINDIVALLGISLVVTGFLRWRKRRW